MSARTNCRRGRLTIRTHTEPRMLTVDNQPIPARGLGPYMQVIQNWISSEQNAIQVGADSYEIADIFQLPTALYDSKVGKESASEWTAQLTERGVFLQGFLLCVEPLNPRHPRHPDKNSFP